MPNPTVNPTISEMWDVYTDGEQAMVPIIDATLDQTQKNYVALSYVTGTAIDVGLAWAVNKRYPKRWFSRALTGLAIFNTVVRARGYYTYLRPRSEQNTDENVS